LKLKKYKNKFLGWFLFSIVFSMGLYFGIDKKILIFTTFLLTIFTEIFVGLSALIAAIPVIGPLILKIVSIPIFWILNALGTLVSGLAIKKGYTTKLAKGRIITLALLIGIIIGYIIGHLIPLK
jgi:hypothetical protein